MEAVRPKKRKSKRKANAASPPKAPSPTRVDDAGVNAAALANDTVGMATTTQLNVEAHGQELSQLFDEEHEDELIQNGGVFAREDEPQPRQRERPTEMQVTNGFVRQGELAVGCEIPIQHATATEDQHQMQSLDHAANEQQDLEQLHEASFHMVDANSPSLVAQSSNFSASSSTMTASPETCAEEPVMVSPFLEAVPEGQEMTMQHHPDSKLLVAEAQARIPNPEEPAISKMEARRRQITRVGQLTAMASLPEPNSPDGLSPHLLPLNFRHQSPLGLSGFSLSESEASAPPPMEEDLLGSMKEIASAPSTPMNMGVAMMNEAMEASAPSLSPRSAVKLREEAKELEAKEEQGKHHQEGRTLGAETQLENQEVAESAGENESSSRSKDATEESTSVEAEESSSITTAASRTVEASAATKTAAATIATTVAAKIAATAVEKVAHISSEKVASKVRSSFAKMKVPETKRLYPTVPEVERQPVRVSSRQDSRVIDGDANEAAAVKAKAKAAATAAVGPPQVLIKLEPHVNYEINMMHSEARQMRQETKMRHIASQKGELFMRLEKYLFAEYLVRIASSSLHAKKQEIEDILAKTWSLEKKRLCLTKKCGDHVAMDQTLEFQTAKLESSQMERLKNHLEKNRQLRTMQASLHTYDRAMAYFQVEQYLESVMNDPLLTAFITKLRWHRRDDQPFDDHEIAHLDASFHDTLNDEGLIDVVNHLKYCIDVLLFFEKQVTMAEKSFFYGSRVPSSFCRGEITIGSGSNVNGGGTNALNAKERRLKCFACNQLNAPLEPNENCKLCENCEIVLFIPPSTINFASTEWFSSVLQFRIALKKWTSLCLERLLNLKSLTTTPYLLMHLLYLPRIGQDERAWLLRFLQFPKAMLSKDGTVVRSWNEEIVDHYIAMLHLVFHPEKLRQLARVIRIGSGLGQANAAPNGIPNGNAASTMKRLFQMNGSRNGRRASPSKVAIGTNGSAEWVLLENPEMLDRIYLSDTDFMALLNQFPNKFAFEQVFNCCVMNLKKGFSRALTIGLELTAALTRFQEFDCFSYQIAILLSDLLVCASRMPIGTMNYPTLFDQLFLTCLKGLLCDEINTSVVWKTFSKLPFTGLTASARWDAFGLFFGVAQVPGELKNQSAWTRFMNTSPLYRKKFHQRVQDSPESSMDLFHAMASLAASCSLQQFEHKDLIAVVVHELFVATFTVVAAHEKLRHFIQNNTPSGSHPIPLMALPISTICLSHPHVISQLISLVFAYHESSREWLELFETVPINRWLPTSVDLVNLQEWLVLENMHDVRHQLARFLMERINWDYDFANKRPFLPAQLHRQVAIILAEAVVLQETKQKQMEQQQMMISSSDGIKKMLFLETSTEVFVNWCWKMVLKLKFYDFDSKRPLLRLISLDKDRGKQALTLRRWFSSKSSSKIKFYENEMPQFLVDGFPDESDEDEQRSTAGETTGVHFASASGAPMMDPSTYEKSLTIEEDEHNQAPLWIENHPIVCFVVCQMTDFLFGNRLDRWEPLVVLLRNGLFEATISVVRNVVPALAAQMHQTLLSSPAVVSSGEDAASSSAISALTSLSFSQQTQAFVSTLESFSSARLIEFIHELYRLAYLTAAESIQMEEVLQRGVIAGGFENESMTKKAIMDKLQVVFETSRFVHPLVWPTLVEEYCIAGNGNSNGASAMHHTSALVNGAFQWLSSTLRGQNNVNTMVSAIRKSSFSSVLTGGNRKEISKSARALCRTVGQCFEGERKYLPHVMRFLLKSLIEVPFWNENHGFRVVVDTLITKAFEQHCFVFDLVDILSVKYKCLCLQVQNHFRKTQIKEELPTVLSFLPVVESNSLFGGGFDVAQFVDGCPMLAFWCLLIETRLERPLLMALGQVMIKYEPKTMKKIEKMKRTQGKLAKELESAGFQLGTMSVGKSIAFGHLSFDSLSEYKFYRWCEFCLGLDEREKYQILFWQVLFALYFACNGGTKVFGHYFLDRHKSQKPKRVHLKKNLQEKLRRMSHFCSAQAQVALTSVASSVNSPKKEQLYRQFVTLTQVYTAMDAWIEEKNPNKWLEEDQLLTLPRHFEVERLKEVLLLSDLLLNTPNDQFEWRQMRLWTELCNWEVESLANVSAVVKNGVLASQHSSGDLADVDGFTLVEGLETLRRHSSFLVTVPPGYTGKDVEPLSFRSCRTLRMELTSLPHVTIDTKASSCVVSTSIVLNKHALKNIAIKFSENLSILVAMDADLVDHVTQLYQSKDRVVTQSKSCIEGSNCKKPAVFKFEFAEWTMDKTLNESIKTILKQSERCDLRSMEYSSSTLMGSLDRLVDESHFDDGVGDPDSSSIGHQPVRIEDFLQLDGDGMVLCMQMLLMERIVHLLHLEHQRINHEKALADEAPKATQLDAKGDSNETDEKDVESSASDGKKATLQDDDSLERKLNRVHEKGLEWFHLLTELDSKLVRMVVPLRELLFYGIKRLGTTFVCVDERETCTLLQLMLDDPNRINTLSECFVPSSAPSRFVEMFSKLFNASCVAKLTTDQRLFLLKRFDFRSWLACTKPVPSVFDRETVLTLILNELCEDFPADPRLVTEDDRAKLSVEVLRVHVHDISVICQAHLEDHIEKTVHSLVGAYDDYHVSEPVSSMSSGSNLTIPRVVHGLLWDVIVAIPQDKWQKLPMIQIEALVDFLSSHVSSLRWQSIVQTSSSPSGPNQVPSNDEMKYPLVYWHQLGVLKKMLDLLLVIVRVSSTQLKEEHETQWNLITKAFEPLLSTLYQPATNTEASSISTVWPKNDSLATGNAICSAFVVVCCEFLKDASGKDGHANRLDLIWSFYLNSLIPRAPAHVCKQFHQSLTRINWEEWRLTLEIVQQMRDMMQAESQAVDSLASTASGATEPKRHSSAGSSSEVPTCSSYPFVSWLVRDILCRMTWSHTEAWLNQQTDAVRSVFLVEFAKLCVDLVLDVSHFQAFAQHNDRYGTNASMSHSLPPYFVNFLKQQQDFWRKYNMKRGDWENFLRHFCLEKLQEPYTMAKHSRIVMTQDAFTRIQLTLRFLNQMATLQNDQLDLGAIFDRMNGVFRLIHSIFESEHKVLHQSRDQQAWSLVLYAASCSIFFEKLDEIVQAFRRLQHSSTNSMSASVSGALDPTLDDRLKHIKEEDLTAFLTEVLRFCNLPFVEKYLKQEDFILNMTTSNLCANWTKCGNVVAVDIDSLLRDFTNLQKNDRKHHRLHESTQSLEDSTNDQSWLQSTSDCIGNCLSRVLWSFMAFRGSELACLGACGRAVASVQVMSMVTERCIEKWIIEHRSGSWEDVAAKLKIPELSEDEFETCCLASGNMMTLQVLFVQQVCRVPSLNESFVLGVLSRVMHWMNDLEIYPGSTVGELKVLFFAAEMTNFICKTLVHLLPEATKKQMLRDLCNNLFKLGNSRKNQGIMKAIGMGGSLKYSMEFHVCCLAIGVFVRLQTRASVSLRVDDRIPLKITRTSEKHLKHLEQLLASKDCLQLSKRMEGIVEFIKNPKRSLADQDEFFVSLFARVFPSHPWMLVKSV